MIRVRHSILFPFHLMSTTADKAPASTWEELFTPSQGEQLQRLARQRNWGRSLILVGWLHLLAFSLCYYLTIVQGYHEAAGYLGIWVSELLATGLIFRLGSGPSRGARA